MTEDLKAGLNLFEKQLIYNLTLNFILTTTLPKTLIENYEHALSLLNFACSWQPWQNKGKVFLKGNLNWYILGTDGHRKLKFGEVSLRICQNFLRQTQAKKILT